MDEVGAAVEDDDEEEQPAVHDSELELPSEDSADGAVQTNGALVNDGVGVEKDELDVGPDFSLPSGRQDLSALSTLAEGLAIEPRERDSLREEGNVNNHEDSVRSLPLAKRSDLGRKPRDSSDGNSNAMQAPPRGDVQVDCSSSVKDRDGAQAPRLSKNTKESMARDVDSAVFVGDVERTPKGNPPPARHIARSRPWFATKDTEVTRRLRALLENQEQDEQFADDDDCEPALDEEAHDNDSAAPHANRFEKGRPWFATKDTEVTRRLRSLLENQDEDDRFIDESAFHFQRRGINRLFSNDDERVDFWSSTEYHGETPRPKLLTSIKAKESERHFLCGDVVIFPNPRRAQGAPTAGRRGAEWTGRVASSPFNENISVRAQQAARRANARNPTPSVVRRGSGADNLYKVEVVAKRILGGILGAQEHEFNKIIEEYQTSRRERSGTRRRRAHYELLHINVLESPDETRRRKLSNVVTNWLLRYLRRSFGAWLEMVAAQREAERRCAAATRIEGFWRCVLSRSLSLEKRIAAQMAADQRQRELERVREAERQEAAKRAREAYLREHGVTRDGVRFFETQAEMDAFYARMERMCARIGQQLEVLATGLKTDALARWRYYLERVLPPAHLDVDALSEDVGGLRDLLARELGDEGSADELGDLDSKLSAVAARQAARGNEAREKTNEMAPWHAALGAHLPGLPTVGAHLSHLGKLVIEDMTQYEKFKQYQHGPTDSTAWLLRGAYAKILFGAYPSGQAHKRDRKITSRSGAIASVLMAGVDTFVCLMNPEEVHRMAAEHLHGLSFNQEADETCAEIRSELSVGVAATKEAWEGAAQRAARGRKVGYGRPQQEALDRAEANRRQEYRKAKANLDNFSEKLQHVFFPMPCGGGHKRPEDDARLLAFCRDLELRLRRQERLYIFSQGGSGRAGVVAAILLARLYGLEPLDALRRVQRYHDTMLRFQSARPENVPTCPRSVAQRAQVVRVLELGGDAAMDLVTDRAWAASPVVEATADPTAVQSIRERAVCARGSLLPSPSKR